MTAGKNEVHFPFSSDGRTQQVSGPFQKAGAAAAARACPMVVIPTTTISENGKCTRWNAKPPAGALVAARTYYIDSRSGERQVGVPGKGISEAE